MLKLARRALRLAVLARLGRLLLPLEKLATRRAAARVPRQPRVLLLGWYGTETVGDRAILAECCRLLQDAYGPCRFQLASSRPAFSRRTLEQLELDFPVVSPALAEIGRADLVVVAGGPVMDDPEMLTWWLRLLAARWLGKPCVLLGVGAHPLKTMLALARSLAALSQRVALREEGALPGRVFVDPALYAPIPHRPERGDGFHLAVNLRPWPPAFYRGPHSAYRPTWERFLGEVLAALEDLCRRGVVQRLTLFPMHDVPPDDDRLLYQSCAALSARFVPEPLTPRATAELLAGADAFLGMRFHANVLAALAGTPGLGLDYDSSLGKITWFYGALGLPERALPLARVTRGALTGAIEAIARDWPEQHRRTVEGRDRLRQTRPQLVDWLAELA